MIFTKVHLLASKLVLVVATHSLGGSWTNWPNTPTLTRVPLNQHKHISHEQSTRVPFSSPPEGQEPLAITMVRAWDNHQPPLNDPRCTKPSRSRQTLRVTNKSHSETRSPSASRCNHSSNALRCSPNLTKMIKQRCNLVGVCWLGSQDCYVNENGQERAQAGQQLFIDTPKQRVVGSLIAQKTGALDAQTVSCRTLAPNIWRSDGSHVSYFWILRVDF